MFLSKPMLGTQLDRSDSLNNPVLDLLFNEGHGDRVNDLSGYGNHGTLHGFDFPSTKTSGWNPEMDGVALTFDGVNDYIDYGNNPSLNITKAMTIDLSFYLPNGYTAGDANMGVLGNNVYDIHFYGDGGTLYFMDKSGSLSDDRFPMGGFTSPGWYRVVFTYDGSYKRWFRNGVLGNIEPTTGTMDGTNASCLKIGVCYSYSTNYFNGEIARARILPRAMSAFEVMQTQIDPWGMYLQ